MRNRSISVPVERHRLDNGLDLVLSRDDTTPIVAVNLWYGVGSRDEREGRTGFAHLFEHMMFQGSQHVPKNRHFELIERAGGSLNASTWFDRTNYYETVPSHHLETALWLEADRMGWMVPALTQEKLDNQRDVVKNEKRQRYDNQPYGDWDERVQALLFPPDHPYHHTVIGSMEDLDAATLEDVSEFFRTYYAPDNCVLTIAGDFAPDRALAAVERYFGDVPPAGPVPPVPGRTSIPGTLGWTARQAVVSEVPLPRVIIACRIPPFTDPSYYTADVASGILGSGRASRLYRTLVRERRLARDTASFTFPLVTGVSMMLLVATGLPGVDPEALERAMVDQMEGLVSVDEGDVARAAALTETQFLRGIERLEERADRLSMCTMLFDDPARVESEMERVRAVTPDGVQHFQASHLGDDNRAVLHYVPGDEG